MTVNELTEKLGLEQILVSEGDREIQGAYAGDLLSWVMGRASCGNCWVTIMTNINTLAVASLLDLSCIIICENSEISGDLISAAQAKGLNLLRTGMTEYETCVSLGQVI
ncbi:MAG: hypothetical protein J5760_02735 [Clostridia bacterium]|nr:hypothetical protein [Clostridia bacterium]